LVILTRETTWRVDTGSVDCANAAGLLTIGNWFRGTVRRNMFAALVDNLHRAEEGRIRRFFMRRFRNAADAADATQETFLRMLDAPSKTVIENPQAYLFQVAKSVARVTSARLAADTNLFLPEILGADRADDAPCQERVVSARQCLLRLAKTIEKLPNRCQEVFILSRLHGLANGEIAGKLGISRNMVEKHIIKALIHCKKTRAEIFFR
jgi:RNA polymerase sigma-70 factor (ECF subfamily)